MSTYQYQNSFLGPLKNLISRYFEVKASESPVRWTNDMYAK